VREIAVRVLPVLPRVFAVRLGGLDPEALVDLVGHLLLKLSNGFDTNAERQQRGINVVIGNGSLLTAYPREISDMNRPTKKSVSGKVSADVRACEEGTPVRLQRKRSTGWKTIEETWLEFHRFDFNHLSLKTGARYRVYVPAFGLGTPVLTTCGKAAQKFKLES
jgi:hypothetical protein